MYIYLVSIIGDSAVICNEVRDANADAVADAESSNEANSSNKTHFNGNKATCKTQFLLAFLLTAIALLKGVSIYCCLINY